MGAFHQVYASQQVGQSFQPGPNVVPADGGPWRRNSGSAMQRICDLVLNAVFENWMPFTAPIVSRFLGPRAPTTAFESPQDLGIGETITRYGSYPSADRPFPYPYEIGAVSGFMPMMDAYSMAWAWGKTPSGPGVLTPIPLAWQTSYPNLRKVTG